jgi:poly(A) polymerase
MAGAGLIVPVIGGVPHLSRLAGVEAADPMLRLAALAVFVREDAARLREGLRLSNAEFDRIDRIALALEGLSGGDTMPSLARLRHVADRAGQDAAAAALILLATSVDEGLRGDIRDLIARLGRTPPFLPRGQDVLARGVPKGERIGQVLAQARRLWIEAGCPAEAGEQMALVEEAAGEAGIPRPF